jgi:hypothetical protein
MEHLKNYIEKEHFSTILQILNMIQTEKKCPFLAHYIYFLFIIVGRRVEVTVSALSGRH